MDTKKQEFARISRMTYGMNGEITLSGLTAQEVERLEGTLRGQWWAKGNAGRIEFSPAYEPTPAPTEDAMLPQWRMPGIESDAYQTELFDHNWSHQSPSILIQHLCGYNYTNEGYKANAEVLEECGFMCMRSQRTDNGQFWEIWFLPGFWAAKGRLREALHAIEEKKQPEVALELLRRWTSFGTLDTAVQRLCQVID